MLKTHYYFPIIYVSEVMLIASVLWKYWIIMRYFSSLPNSETMTSSLVARMHVFAPPQRLELGNWQWLQIRAPLPPPTLSYTQSNC